MDDKVRERLSLREACGRCEGCCCEKGTPLVTAEEREKIIDVSGRDEMVAWGEFYMMNGEPCPFYADGQCSVQAVKPLVCVAWPVTLRVKEKGVIEAVKVKAEHCAAAAEINEAFIERAVGLLRDMPIDYQRATASLTERFGFEVEGLD